MATLTLQATSAMTDSWFDNFATTTNRGTSTFLQVGEEAGASRIYRGIIKFDLSSIPTGAIITSATLSLKLKTDASTNTRTFRFYRVKRAWVEGECTWAIYSTGNNWGTAGCANTTNDREATDVGSASIAHDATVDTWVDFSMTASKIQEMITGGSYTSRYRSR